jgi:phosphotransferase system HPr (HPr) family protein
MIERSATIHNAAGIHCRPSAVIVKAMQGYTGRVEILHEGHECSPLSVMGLIGLALEQGAEIKVRVDGEDEEAKCEQLVELFQTEFDFPGKP